MTTSDQDVPNGLAAAEGGVQRVQNFKKEELVRLILQSLRDLGFQETVASLERESGHSLETQSVGEFRNAVLEGNWISVEQILPSLGILDSDLTNVQFLVREQKFLESLSLNDVKRALWTLRNELTPLGRDSTRLHKLSSFLMCGTLEELKKKSSWEGTPKESRRRLLSELQRYISPSLMVPERRLETLLSQAVDLQTSRCVYHNTTDNDFCLYLDHTCHKNRLPTSTTHVFDKHRDEVWYVAWAHDGSRLASASKDCTAIVWSIKEKKLLYVLEGHKEPLSFLAWSPNDDMLLTCGNDNKLKLWLTDQGTCRRTLSRHTEAVTCCAWLPCGQKFVSGGLDKTIYLWNLEGSILNRWTGPRVTDLAVNSTGTRLVAVCHEKKIRVYSLVEPAEYFIQETDSITSLCLSLDSRHALVNISSQEIHLWDIEEKKLVRKYSGHRQGRFVIRSCFGGANQVFIVSGSEDCKIYVWHRDQEKLIESLQGHTATVNSVAWNPANPFTFASASDDHTVRVWGGLT